MALPRLTKDEKQQIIEALQEHNREPDAEDGVFYDAFDHEADRIGPYVITGSWDEDPLTGERVVNCGPGPVVVDTRDYSVEFFGSAPGSWPDWFEDKTLPTGRVKLADGPIPGKPEAEQGKL